MEKSRWEITLDVKEDHERTSKLLQGESNSSFDFETVEDTDSSSAFFFVLLKKKTEEKMKGNTTGRR
jgi:hypothetical protein